MIVKFAMWAAAAAAIAAAPCAGQAAPKHKTAARSASDKCYDTADSQAALNDCAYADRMAAERKLDKAWRDVVQYVRTDKECADLKAAQKAWLAFRQADCSFWSNPIGSAAPMVWSECMEGDALDRAKELNEYPPLIARKDVDPDRNGSCKP